MSRADTLLRNRQIAARRLARWRRGRRVTLALLSGLAATVFLSNVGFVGRATDDWAAFDRRRFPVIGVVDGGTFVIQGNDAPVRVRLAGVAAPVGAEHWVDESRRALSARVDGRAVVLRLEVTQTRAADGPLLAYAYPADDDLLNLDVVRDGDAYADRRSPHSMRRQFEQAESEARKPTGARKPGRGLWRDFRDEQMPAWRQAWLAGEREKAKLRRRMTTAPAVNDKAHP